MATTRREVADIRTRFGVFGLDTVQAGFKGVGAAILNVTRMLGGTGAGASAAATTAVGAGNAIIANTRAQIDAAEDLSRKIVQTAREGAQAREKAARDAVEAAKQEADAAEKALSKAPRTNKNMTLMERSDTLDQRGLLRDKVRIADAVLASATKAYEEELKLSRQAIASAEREGKSKVSAAKAAAAQTIAAERETAKVARAEASAREKSARDGAAAQIRAQRQVTAAAREGAAARVKDEKAAGKQVGETAGKLDEQAKKVGKLGGEAKKAEGEFARMAKTIAGIALVGGLAYGAVKLPQKGYDLARKATERAADYTYGQFNTSLSTGLPVAGFQVLADAAKSYGIDTNDLRSSLIQLQGQIKAADQGPDSDIGKAFAQLGVTTRDENGQLKTTNELLIPLVRALQGLGETDRISIGAQLFGEDDVGKLMPLFNQLASAGNGSADGVGIGNDFLKQRSARLAELGGFISQADLARAQQYKTAVSDMETAWNGLSREIAAAVGPDVSRMLSAAATDLARNRIVVAAAFQEAFKTFYGLTRDIGIMVFGGRAYDAQVANKWLLPVRDGLVAVGQVAMATGRLIREAYIAIQGGRDGEVKEFPWLITLRDGFNKGLAYAKTFAKDAWYVVTFQDQNVSGQFPWMATFRQSIMDVVAYAKRAWGELGEVWSGTNANPDTGPAKVLLAGLDELKAFRTYVGEWVTWFQSVGQDVATVWEQIGTGNRSFDLNNEGLRKFAENFLFAADAANKAWGWFKSFYEVVYNAFRDYLGLDFEAILFFVAFAKFTGVLGFATGALKLLKSPLGQVVGLVTAAGSAGTAATAVGSLTTAFGGLSGALAGIAAFATNPLIIALLGLGGGALVASAAKSGVYGFGWLNDLTKYLAETTTGLDEKLQAASARMNDIYNNPSAEQARWRRQRAGMATDDDLAFQQGAAARAQAASDAAWQAKNAQDAIKGDILSQFPGYVPQDWSKSVTPVVFKIEPAQGPAVEVPGYMKRDLVGEAMAAADRTQRLTP